MECCIDREEYIQNKRIEKELQERRLEINRTAKFLMLGLNGSGGRTIAKQMKIIHMNGYTEEERLSFKYSIISNIIQTFRTLIYLAEKLGYPIPQSAQVITPYPFHDRPVISKDLYDAMISVWNDIEIQNIFSHSSSEEYSLYDSTEYFVSNLSRIASDNYIPSEQDILRVHSPGLGFKETQFQIEDVFFHLYNLAPNMTERGRAKILPQFEDVLAILFIVSLSDYNVIINGDNELLHSLKMFEELCDSRWFTHSTIILFLNKKDVFAEKIKTTPLEVCFPDYQGDPTYEAYIEYIREKFQDKNRNPSKPIYSHITCAVDTTNISIVFNATRDIIFRNTI